VAVGSGAAPCAASEGAASGGAEPGGAGSEGARSGGAEPGVGEPEGAKPGGAELEGAESGGAKPRAAGDSVATGPGGARTSGAGAAGTGGVGCAGCGDPTKPGGAGIGGARARGAGAGGPSAAGPGAAEAGVGGIGIRGAGAAGAGAVDPGAGGAGGTVQPCPYFSGGLTERCVPTTHPVLPVRTAHRAPRLRPPPVPGTHTMTLRPSSVPLRIPLSAPPKSSLLESMSASPPSVGGECALGTDVLEDRQEDFECLATTVPHFASMLLAPEGDPDAPDIPTPRSYAEAIMGAYSSQWQAAMDAEMASRKVKQPPSSPPTFKVRYVARGFSQRQGVDYFHNFSPTPKMTTLRVLLHVAAQRDYELHSRDRAWRTITLTQSHMVHHVPQRFGFQYSLPQPTPLSTSHSLSAPPLDESVEPSGPYPELVGRLMYLMTCTRTDLVYPLSLLARYVARGRQQKIDLAVAGWECHGYSRAGEGRGMEDARGASFRDLKTVLEMVKKKQGKVLYILENVDLVEDRREAMKRAFAELEEAVGRGLAALPGTDAETRAKAGKEEGAEKNERTPDEEWPIGGGMGAKTTKALQEVLKQHQATFAYSQQKLGKCTTHQMPINLTAEVPIYQRKTHMSPRDLVICLEKCAELLEAGLIQRSESDYAAATVVAARKDLTGEVSAKRMCGDYRGLNKVTMADRYPMQSVEGIFDKLQGATVFSTLDLRQSFNHIPIRPNDYKKTAFHGPGGLYEWKFMPFGKKNVLVQPYGLHSACCPCACMRVCMECKAMVVVLEQQLHAVKTNEGNAVQGVFDQLGDLYVKLSAAGVDYPENIKTHGPLSGFVLQKEFRRKELTAAAGEGGGSAYGMKGFKGRGSKKGKAKEGSGGEQYSGGKRSNEGGKRCGGRCWYCPVEGHPWFKCRKLLDGWRPGQPSIEGSKGVHGAMGEGMGSQEGDGGAGGHGGMFYHVGEACSEDMVVPPSKVALHRSYHWVINTGAFMTMTNREDLLDEVKSSKAATVVSATGQVVPVRGEGRAMFMGADGRLVGLKRVLLVPGLCANLLSTKALIGRLGEPASKVALHRSSHWVIDTGAFMTMTNREDLLDEVRPSKAATVVSATGQVVPVRGEGRAMFMGADGRLVGLKRVLLVPGLCANLLSTKALSEAGMKMEMMGTKVFKATLDGRVLWDLQGGKDMHRSMWEIPVLPWKEAAARLAVEAVRGGHASHVTCGGGGDGSDGGLLVHGGVALPSGGKSQGARIKGEPKEVGSCETCLTSKFSWFPFHSEVGQSTDPVELVHVDLVGPMKVKGEVAAHGGARERQAGEGDCSDRGGEFLGAEFRSWLKRHGIKQQLTTAYTPQSNGVAERANRTIIEDGRTILVDSGLPLRFWPIVIRHATVIKNWVLTHVGGQHWVPMEKWSGKKPLVDMLRVFGCMGLVHVPKEKRDKLQAAAVSRDFGGAEGEVPDVEEVLQQGEAPLAERRDTEEEVQQPTPSPKLPPRRTTQGKRDAVRGGAKERAANERPKRAAHPRDFLKYERLGVPKALLVQEEEDEEEKGAKGEMEQICCFGVNLPHEPASMEEALAGDDREAWLASREDEFQSHMENETWTLTNLPPGRNALDCTWVLRVKTDAEGTLERRKTRLVIKGFQQREGIYFQEVFAPVAKAPTLRLLIAAVAVCGWNQPEGYDDGSARVCRLKKTIYGLKQAPKCWYARLVEALEALGFKVSGCDESLFMTEGEEEKVFLLVYVDDILLFSPSLERIKEVQGKLKETFQCKALGPVGYYLGLHVERDKVKGWLRLQQHKYLTAMGEKYGLEEGRSVKTPLPSGFQLHLDEEEGEVLDYELQYRFQLMAPSRAPGCSREAGEVLHGNLKGGAAIFSAWAVESKGSGGVAPARAVASGGGNRGGAILVVEAAGAMPSTSALPAALLTAQAAPNTTPAAMMGRAALLGILRDTERPRGGRIGPDALLGRGIASTAARAGRIEGFGKRGGDEGEWREEGGSGEAREEGAGGEGREEAGEGGREGAGGGGRGTGSEAVLWHVSEGRIGPGTAMCTHLLAAAARTHRDSRTNRLSCTSFIPYCSPYQSRHLVRTLSRIPLLTITLPLPLLTITLPLPLLTITLPLPLLTITLPLPLLTITLPSPLLTITLPSPLLTITIPAPLLTITIPAVTVSSPVPLLTINLPAVTMSSPHAPLLKWLHRPAARPSHQRGHPVFPLLGVGPFLPHCPSLLARPIVFPTRPCYPFPNREGVAREGVAREGVRVRVRGSAVDLASMGGLFLRERVRPLALLRMQCKQVLRVHPASDSSSASHPSALSPQCLPSLRTHSPFFSPPDWQVSWGQEWVDQLRADTWMHAFSFTGAQQQEAGRKRQGRDEGDDRGNSDKDVTSGGVIAAGYAGAAPQERDTGNSTAEGESAGTAMQEGGSAGSAVDSGDSGAVDVFQVLLDASHGTAEVLVEQPLRAHSGSQPRTTLSALGFAPSTADPSLFLRTDTSLPPFYVLVYVDDLVIATADTEALTLVNSELQKRHTCTDLGPSALWFLVLLATAHYSVYRPLALSSTFGRVLRKAWCSCLEDGVQLSSQVTQTLLGSTRSSLVVSSSCEADIYVGAMAAQDLRWLTYPLTDLEEQPHSPPVLYVDNKAMIALCQEHILEHRTNHIALRYFLARELQQRGQLCLAYVATRANTADIFTKVLPPGDHQCFSIVFGLVPTLPHLLTA
ncbi:unnamed protein product, partial [Closterium sp. NIES-53]